MKLNKILLAITAIIMFSCADDIEIQENSNTNELTTFSQNPTYMDVEAIYIDNGTPQNCEFNMLVFQDESHYIDILETLEELYEDYEDAFVNQYDHLDDDELEDLEDQIGHEEYAALIEFENQLNFCSLRRLIAKMQADWLDQQGYNSDFSGSPEETYLEIDDEFESTVLNEQGEVIVGRNLYKYYDNGYIIIDLDATNVPDILRDLNNGATPEEVALDYRPFVEVVEQITVTSPTPGECHERIRGGKRVELNHNTMGRVSWRINENMFQYRMRSKLRGYTWTGSRWKRKRMRLATGIVEGTTLSHPNSTCYVEDELGGGLNSKRRRKTRVNRHNISKIFAPHPWQYVKNLHTIETLNWVAGHEFVVPVSDLLD
ncbi:MAG: hypothetical protein LAT51_10155 [Flavobacteriaceae bacterium]|nr:hypothetical protein [Flavobacteriaceae bacterium]